jgi:fatty-acyl-CoA synthase
MMEDGKGVAALGAKLLPDLIFERAQRHPDDDAYIYLEDDGSETRMSAREMSLRAASFARALGAIGIRAGELIVLVLPQSLGLVSAFWGTMSCGATPAIFPFLSPKLDPRLYRERVAASAAHSGARAVITTPEFKDKLAGLFRDPECRVFGRDEVMDAAADGGADQRLGLRTGSLDEAAFLLHTSGSSGIPKGMLFSHRAVLHHIRSMSLAFGMRPNDVIVSWLPLHHDMGLYLGLILPAFVGVPVVLMSPFHWISSPKSLVRAVHEYRGTVTWMPNFAFNHCASGILDRDLEGLDLSSWRLLGNSSEPVHKSSFEMFLKRFTPYGFRESMLASAYGLTEQGLATCSPLTRPPRVDWVRVKELQEAAHAVPARAQEPGAIPSVSSGVPVADADLLIVDEQGRPLPERRVGEILLRSPFTVKEYHRLPELTAETIQDGWLHTGDAGYWAEGELFVCGRLKDLIIAGGKNVYPQDLEAVADTVSGIRPGRSVAFGLADERAGTEGIVMVCELREKLDAGQMLHVERELRRRVVQELDVTLTCVEFIAERGWIIKTSGGKVARAANRAKYLALREGETTKTKGGGRP